MTALAGPATAPLDVAMLPVWGWRPILGPGHLDPIGAAAAVRLLPPAIMRVALPVAFFTLGLGSVLLLGAAVVAIFLAVPGVEIRNFRTGVIVAVAISALGALDEQPARHRRGRDLLPASRAQGLRCRPKR